MLGGNLGSLLYRDVSVMDRERGYNLISECKYDYGVWGDCDIDTNKRTRVRTLITADEDCQPEKSVAKTCTKSNGEGI